MPGEQTLPHIGWTDVPANRGSAGEPTEAILNRILVRRYQRDGIETPTQVDASVEGAFAGKLTLEPGEALPGDRLFIHGWAVVPTQNGATNLTPRVRIGGLTGVVIATCAAFDPANDALVRWGVWVHIESVGTPTNSKIHALGLAKRTGGSADEETVVKGNTTLDFTAAIDIVLTQQWAAHHVDNKLTCYDFAAELYRTRKAA